MFTISDPTMVGKNGSYGGNIFKLDGGDTTAITFNNAESIPDLSQSESTVITGGTITTTIPEPITVQVGNQVFDLALDATDPQPGEFVNNDGIITLTGNTSTNTGAIVRGYSDTYAGTVPTTRIVNPDQVLRQYNATGNFSASRNLEGHPSASLEFIVQGQSVPSIRAQFRNNREVRIYGVGYRVASVTFNRLSERLYPGKPVGVTIDFKGKWESWGNPSQSPLDTPIKLRKLVCDRKRDLTVGDLCSQVGISYTGPKLAVKVRGNVDRTASTTVRQEIEQTAENHGGFVYWSNPVAIEVRPWNIVSSRRLPNADVLSESITYNANGEHDVYVDGVQLSKIYDQARWQPESNNQDDNANPLAVVLTIEYENAVSNDAINGFDLRLPPGYNQYGQAQSLDNSVLRNPSNNWDSGGPTKTERLKVTVQGEPVLEKTTTYGFVFTTSDTYELDGSNNIRFKDVVGINDPANFWVQVEKTAVIYKYDTDNYLIGSTTMGTRKARPRQETESLEMIRLDQELANGGDPADVNFVKALFTPQDLPVNAVATYQLENFSSYYDDIEPENQDDDACQDSQWVEPKFARLYEFIDNSTSFGDNPDSTTEELLPAIAFGKNYKERRLTTVVIPNKDIKKPERHSVTEYKQNQEGQGLSNGLNVGSSNLNDGRPSVQPRVEPASKDTAIARSQGVEDIGSYSFWFGTDAINPNAPEKESVNFTYVNDPDQARAIAALRLAKENTKNAFTCSVNVRYKTYYNEGDTLLWEGKRWRILGISDTQEISDYGEVNSSFLTLNLGRDLKPSVSMIRVANADKEPTDIGTGGTGSGDFTVRF